MSGKQSNPCSPPTGFYLDKYQNHPIQKFVYHHRLHPHKHPNTTMMAQMPTISTYRSISASLT
ncbi:hypothetical protein DFO62_103360 [Serratia fonticola]|nr:hypothetical protein DFO62_103360 [Serratia fonticola]